MLVSISTDAKTNPESESITSKVNTSSPPIGLSIIVRVGRGGNSFVKVHSMTSPVFPRIRNSTSILSSAIIGTEKNCHS